GLSRLVRERPGRPAYGEGRTAAFKRQAISGLRPPAGGRVAGSDAAAHPRPVRFAYLPLQQLAGGVAGELFDEVDRARLFVSRQALVAKGDQLIRGRADTRPPL